MKGLIVRQPWLDLILDGKKTLEMRSRKSHYRGEAFLIESGSGLIKGKCLFTDCINLSPSQFESTLSKHCVEDFNLLEKWHFGWVLESASRFETPIPYTHPRGAVIWVDLSENDELIEFEEK